FFFFIHPSRSALYTLSLHDALPIYIVDHGFMSGATFRKGFLAFWKDRKLDQPRLWRGRQHGYGCSRRSRLDVLHQGEHQSIGEVDRKSTRLNSSHLVISYAVFCLKK